MITPSSTPVAQLRAALRANVEQAGGLQTSVVVPAGIRVDSSVSVDYQAMVDEALGAVFAVLDQNLSGAPKTAVAALRALAGF